MLVTQKTHPFSLKAQMKKAYFCGHTFTSFKLSRKSHVKVIFVRKKIWNSVKIWKTYIPVKGIDVVQRSKMAWGCQKEGWKENNHPYIGTHIEGRNEVEEEQDEEDQKRRNVEKRRVKKAKRMS